jgi:hypothetical protein
MSNNDYTKQLEHLGKDLSDADRQLAIINGIQNNIGALLDWVQKLDARVMELEEKIDEIS